MNKLEELKAQKDGLDVGADIPRYARLGLESIEEGDLERLKWWGVFFRKQTPGYFMMRLRIPSGVTSAAQLRAIATLANRMGRGRADITTRQQVQLRWIRIGDVPEILDRLLEVGLVTLQTGMDNLRNIIGCPAFGLTPNELLDASPAARAFTTMFVGSKTYTNLPRKFNVGITGCRENCTHAETQDVALVPAVKSLELDEVKGFNVLVGGKNGSGGYRVASPLDVFVRPEEAAELCSAIVLVFRDHGSREARNKVRLAFLLEAWGEAQFREAVEARMGRRLEKAGADQRLGQSTDHVGVFRQKQSGLNYVGLLVPVGRVTGDQLHELARVSEQYGTGEVRLTVDQNVIIPHVPDPKLGQLTAEPLLKTLRYDPPGVLRGLVSCTGVEFCNLAVIETKSRALTIAQGLASKVPATKAVRIHWSGCPAGCGNHTVADIGLLGTKTKVDGKVVDAVDIFMGGASGPLASQGIKMLESVPCDELPRVLEGLVRFGEFERVRRQIRLLQPTLAAAPSPERLAPPPGPVIRADEIPEGRGKGLTVSGTEVAVFKCEGQLYVTQNWCPHAGAALAAGLVDGDAVVCPGHGYRFDLKTGACSTDAQLTLRTYRLVPEGPGFTIQA
ncbi:MAG TPA: Rieske 2Fe-2S domain-containing protein [Methylomirabilota bacterium]|nr:Rieske 2Fe-2S domain-containing protein [Methylomirabilota bacterium]